MKRRKWGSRGSRVSLQGFRLMWAGLAMLVVFVIAGIARVPRPVVVTVVALIFVLALTGLSIVLWGSRIDNRELAENYRKVAAGEPPVPPRTGTAGAVPPAAGAQLPDLAGADRQAGEQRQAQAATALAELKAGPRRSVKLVGATALSCACFWAAAIAFFLAITGPQLNPAGFAAAVVFLALCLWSGVAAVRMLAAGRRRRPRSP